MSEAGRRMTDRAEAPTLEEVEAWVGSEAFRLWALVAESIERNYPGVFAPEWLSGGKKHGWALRYRKGKAFCTFIPEKDRFALQIVFGAEERAKVEAIRGDLSKSTRRGYDQATTYHDGKWLLLTVDSEGVAEDVERLLAVKRKPKRAR